MRAAVIGMGSIGKRHLENLKTLGVEAEGYDLGDYPGHRFDFACVCVPTHSHLDVARHYLSRRMPCFIEKPLAESVEEIDEMCKYEGISMVGCNLRFTKAVEFMKAMTKPLSIHARVCDGSDARLKYGDIVLQDIHEFDYLSWIFGPIRKIVVERSLDGSSYEAIIRFESGNLATVHGDRKTKKYCRKAVVQTDYQTFDLDIDVDNQMYLEEMKYFINCINLGIQPMNSVREASHVTKLLLEAANRGHHSSEARCESSAS